MIQVKNLNVHPVLKSQKRRCPFLWAGFGLTKEYVEKVTYEDIFNLIHHSGWSFTEAYNLPVRLRSWFIDRLIKVFETSSDQE